MKIYDVAGIERATIAAVRPDAAWAALFLGEGFDPVDGASRVKNLSRATGNVYATLRGAGVAIERGISHVFLQVEEGNTSAQALYQRAGFTTAWRYHYWRLSAA
jgi:N-acetylglutamate synthase